MAKYKLLKEPVFISSAEQAPSQYGGYIWLVKFVGIKTQKNYKTYLDPKNNNWSKWSGIVQVAQRKGVVLTGLKFKDQEAGLINADSEPQAEYIVPTEVLLEELEAYWREQDQWNKLFGDSDDANDH